MSSNIPSAIPRQLETTSEDEQRDIQAFLAYHLEATRRMSTADFCRALQDANIE